MGKEVHLRGVNIGSWLLIEPWVLDVNDEKNNGFETEKDIWDFLDNRSTKMNKLKLIRSFRDNWFTENDTKKIAALDMNCVRLPIWWRATDESDYDGSFDYINQSIKRCNSSGLYVILDLHGAPGGQNNNNKILGEKSNPTDNLWNNITLQNQFVEWWEKTANLYKNESNVAGYDILNEGTPKNFSDMTDLYNRTYHAIRNIDRKHIIILEVGDKSENLSLMPSPKEMRDMDWSNIIYSFHYYPTNCTDPDSFKTDFPHLKNASKQYDVPIYVGEFNTIQIQIDACNDGRLVRTLNPSERLSLLKTYRDIFDDYGWSWTFWTYKKIERNPNYSWGLYGYANETLTPDFKNNSLKEEDIESAFEHMRTENLGDLPAKAVFEKRPKREQQ